MNKNLISYKNADIVERHGSSELTESVFTGHGYRSEGTGKYEHYIKYDVYYKNKFRTCFNSDQEAKHFIDTKLTKKAALAENKLIKDLKNMRSLEKTIRKNIEDLKEESISLGSKLFSLRREQENCSDIKKFKKINNSTKELDRKYRKIYYRLKVNNDKLDVVGNKRADLESTLFDDYGIDPYKIKG